MLEAYDPKRLEELVDEANIKVYGMTLQERRINLDYRDNLEVFDRPAYLRNKKVSDVLRK